MKLVHYTSNLEMVEMYNAIRRAKNNYDYCVKIETLDNISMLVQSCKYGYQEFNKYSDVLVYIESFLEDVFELYPCYKKCDCVYIVVKCGQNTKEFIVIK